MTSDIRNKIDKDMCKIESWGSVKATKALPGAKLSYPSYRDGNILASYIPGATGGPNPDDSILARTIFTNPSTRKDFILLLPITGWSNKLIKAMGSLQFELKKNHPETGHCFLEAIADDDLRKENFATAGKVVLQRWEILVDEVSKKVLIGYLFFDHIDVATGNPVGKQYKTSWRWIN